MHHATRTTSGNPTSAQSAAARDEELVPLPGPIPQKGGGKDFNLPELRAAQTAVCLEITDRVGSMTERIDLAHFERAGRHHLHRSIRRRCRGRPSGEGAELATPGGSSFRRVAAVIEDTRPSAGRASAASGAVERPPCQMLAPAILIARRVGA